MGRDTLSKETTDNTSEGKIPIKSGNSFVDSAFSFNETEDRIESNKPLRIPPGTLEIGNQLGLDDGTGTLIYRRNFDDQVRICLTLGFDDTGTIQLPFNTEFDPKQIRDVIQPDDTGEITDTEIINVIPSTANQFVSKVYYKVGTTAPTDDLNFKLYINSIAPENLVVDLKLIECCEFPLSAETEFSFDLHPLVGLLIGQMFYSVFSSNDPFSLQANTANTIPWAAVDRQAGDGFRVLDERDIPAGGAGDMLKLDYDTTDNGIVDNSEKLNGENPSYYLDMDNMVESATAKIFSSTERTKLTGVESGAEVNQPDSEIKTQYENNANTNAFTDAEKSKVAGLESSKFLGEFISLVALETAHPSPLVGSYANVDAGVGNDVERYVWDDNDSKYVLQLGESTQLTASEVKTLYESNPDTNAFTDSDESKLDGIEAGAEVNQTDSEIKTQYENNADTNAFTDAEKTKLGNQSGTNTGDQDLSGLAEKSNVLELDNTTPFIPMGDYHPATKKYVDNRVVATLTYKGGYDAANNIPDLEVSPSGIMLGDFYTITSAGIFFTAAVEIGDAIIAEIDNATAETDWTILNRHLDAEAIKMLYESNPDTNAFTDAEKTNLGNQSGTNTGDQDLSGLVPEAPNDGKQYARKNEAWEEVSAGSALFISFGPNDALFPSTNPTSAFSRNGHPILNYDDTTAEKVDFKRHIQSGYGGEDIKVDVDWVAETATSGAVTWGVEFERNTPGGNDIDSDSFAAQQTGNSTTNGTSGVITRTTITLTQAQADGLIANDDFRMRVERVTGDGGDTMTGDAQILGVIVRV